MCGSVLLQVPRQGKISPCSLAQFGIWIVGLLVAQNSRGKQLQTIVPRGCLTQVGGLVLVSCAHGCEKNSDSDRHGRERAHKIFIWLKPDNSRGSTWTRVP